MVNETYLSYFFLALSIVLIVLGAISASGANKITDESTKTNAKRSAVGVIIIGVLFFIGSIVNLFGSDIVSYAKGATGGNFYYF